jgi:hypothetical protein
MAKIIYQDKNFTIRHLSKEEFEKEFPDSDEDQEMPSTDVGEDPEENEGENETASQLADAFKRVANGKSAVRTVQVTERKVNAPAPEPTRTPNETSDALAKAMERIRNQK